MQDFDFLFVVAQVAVAFAGFASIVAALVRVDTREYSVLNTIGASSVSALAFMLALGREMPVDYRSSATAWVVFVLFGLAPILSRRAHWQMIGEGKSQRQVARLKEFALCYVRVFLAAMSAVATFATFGQNADERDGFKAPLIIGHRGGGSGYLPENTLESCALGIDLGADFVEFDLVATRDGELIARHEPNLMNSTNISDLPKFAERKRTVTLDGVATIGFWASDFTLAEIKEVRAVQPIADRDQSFNGKFEIPTLSEIIELVKRKSREQRRPIGIYIETKHPSYHQSIGLPLEDRLLDLLTRAGWNQRGAPVFIESFETANLRYLRRRTELPLVQLVDAAGVNPDGTLAFEPPYDKPYDWVVSGRPGLFADLLTDAGLAEVRTYADAVGPWKPYIRSSVCKVINGKCADINGDGIVNDADRTLLAPTDLLQRAHALGLVVHPYTFRNEPSQLASDYAGNPVTEYLTFYEAGVDGLFSDFADTAQTARTIFRLKR